MLSDLRGALKAHLGAALAASWRLRLAGRHNSLLALEEGRAVVYAFYGSAAAVLFSAYPAPLPLCTMVAPGADGDVWTAACRRRGFDLLRGASLKGGRQALYDMIDLSLSGSNAALVVDDFVVAPGVALSGAVELARDAEAALIPVAVAAQPSGHSSGSMLWPPPFARVVINEGEAMYFAADGDDSSTAAARQELDAALTALTARAREMLNRAEARP